MEESLIGEQNRARLRQWMREAYDRGDVELGQKYLRKLNATLSLLGDRQPPLYRTGRWSPAQESNPRLHLTKELLYR